MNGDREITARENYLIVPLDELCDLCSGITKGRKLDSPDTVDVPYMAVANVQDGRLSLDNVKTIEATPEEIERYLLRPGDLLLTEGGDPDKLGRGAIWKGEIGTCIHQNHIFRARKATERIEMEYLAHLVSSPYGKRYFLRQSKQTTGIASINMGQLKRFPVPLPPLEEQRRIAAILDQSTNVENLAAGQLLNLDELACSFFEKTIADARQQGTLNEKSLGDISIVAGQYGATCSSAPYDTNLPRYVRITDVQDNGLLSPDMVSPAGPSTAWSGLRLDPGDLLFARSGATVGKSYMYTSEDGACVFAGYLIRFRLNPSLAIPEFVYGFTRTEAYRSWVATTQRVVAQPNINAKQYASLTIPLPPLSEQRAYCSTYRHIKKQSQVARKRLAHVSRLRQSLSKSLLDDQGEKL